MSYVNLRREISGSRRSEGSDRGSQSLGAIAIVVALAIVATMAIQQRPERLTITVPVSQKT